MDNEQRKYIVGALDTIHHVVRCSDSKKEPVKVQDALDAIIKLKHKVIEM